MIPRSFGPNPNKIEPPTQGGPSGVMQVPIVKMLVGQRPIAGCSCWVLTRDEIEVVRATGRVYVAVLGGPDQMPTTPFTAVDDDCALDYFQKIVNGVVQSVQPTDTKEQQGAEQFPDAEDLNSDG